MTQNHVFLIFDTWGQQHQIVFFILCIKQFAVEESLTKGVQTQHIHEDRDAIIDSKVKRDRERERERFNFHKNTFHVTTKEIHKGKIEGFVEILTDFIAKSSYDLNHIAAL